MRFKLMSDSVIEELNEIRKVPCIKESGECYLVRRFAIFNEEEEAELLSVEDVNVFATEREAMEWIAKKYPSETYDACSCIKETFAVVFHRIET